MSCGRRTILVSIAILFVFLIMLLPVDYVVQSWFYYSVKHEDDPIKKITKLNATLEQSEDYWLPKYMQLYSSNTNTMIREHLRFIIKKRYDLKIDQKE